MMNKKLAAVCFAAMLLTACGTGKAAPEVSKTEETTVSETETSAETQPESVSETNSETVGETEAETTEESITEAPDTSADYREFYKEKLEEFKNEEYSTNPAFDLFDMDNDGIPELFMSHDDYHAAGVFAYSFKDGILVDLSGDGSAYGSYGIVAVSSDGYLSSSYSGMGIAFDSFYRLNGSSLEKIMYTEMGEIPNQDDPDIIDTYYMVNDEKVSQEEYSAVINEYDDHNWLIVGRGNPIDDETIEAVFYAEN